MMEWGNILQEFQDFAGFSLPFLITILGGSLPGAFVAYIVMARQLREDRRAYHEENIRKLYYPLYDASLELFERIEKIKVAVTLDWLDRKHYEEALQKRGFAADPREKGYFIFSSIFLIAKLFCWLEIIHRALGHSYDSKKRTGSEISRSVANISRAFQHKEMWNQSHSIVYSFDEFAAAEPDKKDAWLLHRQFQHSIGELLIVRQAERNECMSFLVFFQKMIGDEAFRYWLRPLEDYFLDMTHYTPSSVFNMSINAGDLRLLRLITIQYWLARLIVALGTNVRLRPSINPANVLDGLPADVCDVICSMDASKTDSFFSRGVTI